MPFRHKKGLTKMLALHCVIQMYFILCRAKALYDTPTPKKQFKGPLYVYDKVNLWVI